MTKFTRSVLPIFLALSIGACGGGSGGGSPVQSINHVPQVQAGADQEVFAGSRVTLSGSASDSDGTIESYRWTQGSGDSVVLEGADTSTAQFDMPERPTSSSFTFTLTAADDKGTTASDTVTINHQNTAPTVDVQSGPIGAAGSLVNLIASASDPDGEIVSYQWTQIEGIGVELSDADTARASFLVPNGAVTSNLIFSLSVTDNRGASASASISIVLLSQVSGRVTFDLVPIDPSTSGLDYESTRIVSARGVLVELVDSENNLVASTTTDAAGEYSLPAEFSSEVRVRVSSQMRRADIWDVKVTDNTSGGALYVGQGELFDLGADDLVRDLHFESGWSGDGYGAVRSAAPFAILDAIYEAKEKFVSVDSSLRFPALEIFWSEKNSSADGSIEEGDIGTSFYQGGNIYILGKSDGDTDEYDRHVVIHEWGHYFEDKLARSDSIGGPHGAGEKLDFRVAFSEGWGNAISAIVTNDQFYRDSSGKNQASGFSIDVENNDVRNPGWFSEGSVHSILFDLYDEQDDGEDKVSLGFKSIYAVLVSANFKMNPFFTSIFSFMDELRGQQGESISMIADLAEGQSIAGTGSDGVGETNDGGISSALPVYRKIDINGPTLNELCTLASEGSQNKLGNSVFISFDVALAGEHLFNATTASGAMLADVDFVIYKSGVVIATAEGTEAGQEKLNLALEEGRYAMSLYGYELSEDTCFDLSITR